MSSFGGCGTEPKCNLLRRAVKDKNRAQDLLTFLANEGCNIEALAGRLVTASEWNRKKPHYAETKPKQLRRLSANLRWCSGELGKSSVTDAIENMLFLSKTEFPNLIQALNNLGLVPLSGKNGTHGNFFHKLPEWMLDIAELLDRGLEETPKLTSQISYWGFLAWAVAEVKRETKREHYERVSELLDLLLEAQGKKVIGPELFKKSIQRHRKLKLSGTTARIKHQRNQ